jgi:imidazolonepropionase-like amidohydrolase
MKERQQIIMLIYPLYYIYSKLLNWVGHNETSFNQPEWPVPKTEPYLIYNAKLINVIHGGFYPENAILIKGARIIKRLPNDHIQSIKTNWKFDAKKKYIIPGLINAHCHITGPGVFSFHYSMLKEFDHQIDKNCMDCITHGVTTIRDMLGFQPAIIKRQNQIDKGQLIGPRILRAIAIQLPNSYYSLLSGGYLGHFMLTAKNTNEMEDAVSKAVDLGADCIKLFYQSKSLFQSEKKYPVISENMIAVAVDKAMNLNKKTSIHIVCVDGFRKALSAGVPLIEHMPIDRMLSDDDIRRFNDNGHFITPTGSVPYALAYPLKDDSNCDHPNLKKIYEDRIERLPEIIKEFANPQIAEKATHVFHMYSQPGYFEKKHLMLTPSARFFNAGGSVGSDNTKKMYGANSKMGCGNDGGIPFVWPAALPLEMRLLQEHAFKPSDILKSATYHNAIIIGMENALGSLDSGKLADMVLLNKNPLEDISNIQEIAGVFKNGQLLFDKRVEMSTS